MDRLLKAIFDRGLGQRQIARETGIPLSTVQRALQRVIYPYRGNVGDASSQDAPTWKKRRAKLESLAIDQLQPTRGPTAPKSRVAPRKSRVTPGKSEINRIEVESPACQGRDAQPGEVAKAATESELKARGVRRAKLAMQPGVNAALVIGSFGKFYGGLDDATLIAHLGENRNRKSAKQTIGRETA